MSKAQTAVFSQKLLSKLQQNCKHSKPCNCTTFSKPLQLLTPTALETKCGAAVQNSSVVLLIQLYVASTFTNLWTTGVFDTTHYYSSVCLTMHFVPTNHHPVHLTYIHPTQHLMYAHSVNISKHHHLFMKTEVLSLVPFVM